MPQKKYFNSTDARNLINHFGFALFPIHGIVDGKCTCGVSDCANPGKHPATNDGFKSATKDIAKLAELWDGRKGLNVGIATGTISGIFVIDIDGEQGEKDLAQLGIDIPETLCAKTGRGRHLFFKYPEGCSNVRTRRGVIGERVDVRGDGGYVAGAGSNHYSGSTYQWDNPLVEPAACPKALLDIVTKDTAPREIMAQPEINKPRLHINNVWQEPDVIDMLSYISPDCGYDEWIQLGMAIQAEGFGFHVWDNWSKGSDKYPKSGTYTHWKSFKPHGGVSFGTLVKKAQDAGWGQKVSKGALVIPRSVVEKEILQNKNAISATDIMNIDLESIPPREFLYSNIVGRKYVTMIVAPPGAGKSILTLSMGISAASGKPWGKWSTPQEMPINVWVYNNEEGFDELRRRLKAIMLDMGIKKEDISGKLYIDSGEHRAISVAGLDREDNVIFTPDYQALKEEVMSRKIDLLIIDPFAETYSINENNNDQIKHVTGLYRKIAVDCNCAVLLVHHTRKGMEGNAGTQAGNADMARGGGAQIGVVRRAFTLTHMDDKEAKKLGVPKEEKRWYIRMDDAKSNITAPADVITWLRLKSVRLGNATKLFSEGDSVGVLNHIEADEIISKFAGLNGQEDDKLIEEVARYMQQKRLDEVNVLDVAKHICGLAVFPYKERTMKDKIITAIENSPTHVPIMAEGVLAFISMCEEKRERNVRVIIREIDDES